MSLVVGRDGSRFAAGAQVLAGIEAERRGCAQRPGLAPALLLAREVLGAVRLAGILDDQQVVLAGEIQDRIHVGHLPVQVHRHDRGHRPAGAPVARTPGRCGSGVHSLSR